MEKDKDDQYWNRGLLEARQLPRQAPLRGYFSKKKQHDILQWRNAWRSQQQEQR